MLHENRIPYQTIKYWALESYYTGCRDYAIPDGWSHEQIMGFVDYNFEGKFERAIEQLMWRVVLFVLSGKWDGYISLRLHESIVQMIREQNLDKILSEIPNDERAEFERDLEILGFIF